MYLVFGVRNKKNYYNCIYEDYKELKDIHSHTKFDNSPSMITSNNPDMIKKMVLNEYKMILDYRNSNKGTLWYPKKFGLFMIQISF